MPPVRTDVTVKFRPDGVGELAKSQKMEAEMRRRGDAVAREAGPGFVCRSFIGATRARASVFPTTFEAWLREKKDKVLTRAIDKARG